MIINGIRITGADGADQVFYDAFNRLGANPDPARLTAALAGFSSADAPDSTDSLDGIASLTEPPTPLSEHYRTYLELNPGAVAIVRAMVAVAAATGDPYRLRVVAQGPALQLTVDENGLTLTVRQMPHAD